MVFVDVRVRERAGGSISGHKVIANSKDDTLRFVVWMGLRKWLRIPGENDSDHVVDAVQSAMGRIKSVKCGDTDLTEFLEEEEATLENLNSESTPTSKGFDIILVSKKDVDPPPEKQLRNAEDLLMKRVPGKMEFLSRVVKAGENLDDQVLTELYEMCAGKELGYVDAKQKEQLKKNTQTIKNALCFIDKFWKQLLRADFPGIPQMEDASVSSSTLLKMMTTLSRQGGGAKRKL